MEGVGVKPAHSRIRHVTFPKDQVGSTGSKVKKDDGYPPFICYPCYDKLTDFKSFRERCRASKLSYERKYLQQEDILGENDVRELRGGRSEEDTSEALMKTERDEEEESLEDADNVHFEIHMSPVKLVYDGEGVSPSNQDAAIPSPPIQLCDTGGETSPTTDRLDPNATDVPNDADIPQEKEANSETLHQPEEESNPQPVKTNPEEVTTVEDQEGSAAGFVVEKRHDLSKRTLRRLSSRCISSTEPFQVSDMCSENTPERRKRKFVCYLCDKSFLFITGLTNHLYLHDLRNRYVCSLCKKSFVNKGLLILHERMHKREMEYVCQYCGKEFMMKRQLISHQIMHTIIKHYRCSLCSDRFVRRRVVKEFGKKGKKGKFWACRDCDQNFPEHRELVMHEKSHTKDEYVCDACHSKRYADVKEAFNEACEEDAQEPHECDVCGKNFAKKRALMMHLLAHGRKKTVLPPERVREVVPQQERVYDAPTDAPTDAPRKPAV